MRRFRGTGGGIFYIMSGLSERVRIFDQFRRAKPELPSDFIKKLITVWLKLLTRIDQVGLRWPSSLKRPKAPRSTRMK